MNAITNENIYVVAQGGIGDLLQFLPFLIQNKNNNKIRIILASHQAATLQILNHFKINPYAIYNYTTFDELLILESKIREYSPIYSCPRSLFFDDIPFPPPAQDVKNSNPIVGIHLWGSQYSQNTALKFNTQPKTIPFDIINALAKLKINILIFGSPNELDCIDDNFPFGNVKLLYKDNIIESLRHVAICDAVIAADSSIKTLSAMLKIPTLVFISDIDDKFRDENFINPYVQKSNMVTYEYSSLSNEKEFNIAKRFAYDFLNRILKLSDSNLNELNK